MSAHNHRHNSSNADWNIPDPGAGGAIRNDLTGYVPLVSAAAETRTLAAPPAVGLVLHLYMDTDGGDLVVTVASAFNATGNNTITFNDARDNVILRSVTVGGALRWELVTNNGASLSTV